MSLINSRKNIATAANRFVIFITLFFSLSFPAVAVSTDSRETIVSATVSAPQIVVFGYTSPLSLVQLEAPDTYAQTYSQSDGYYEFTPVILPDNSSEFCLSSVDTDGRRTAPVCLPPPPPESYSTRIGPIILPPTLTLDSANPAANSTTPLSGQSLPNSPIEITFYQSDAQPLSFPRPVQAFSLPILTTFSDPDGRFLLSLPTSYSTSYRLFASVKYQNQPSPPSNTLRYVLPSLWLLFWRQNWFFVIFIPLFILTLGIFSYLLLFPSRPLPRHLPAIFYFPLVPKSPKINRCPNR